MGFIYFGTPCSWNLVTSYRSMIGQTSQANKKVFILQNHPAGQIQHRNGPVLARGPYVWHPWSKLTFSEPVTYGFRPKTNRLHVYLRGNISGAKSARELLKPSKDLASLSVCNGKKFLVLDFLWVTS